MPKNKKNKKDKRYISIVFCTEAKNVDTHCLKNRRKRMKILTEIWNKLQKNDDLSGLKILPTNGLRIVVENVKNADKSMEKLKAALLKSKHVDSLSTPSEKTHDKHEAGRIGIIPNLES